MLTLSDDQRLLLLDLIESVTNQVTPSAEALNDPQVVYDFLLLAKDTPSVVFSFLQLLSPEIWSALTEQDVLTELVMVELHVMFGFSDLDLVAWLRNLHYGSVQYFKSLGIEKNILKLDELIFKSRYHVHVMDDVRIDELPKYFDSLEKLIHYALSQRITYKQYRIILGELSFETNDLTAVLDDLIDSHQALARISRENQTYPFLLFCGLFDYLPEKNQYLAGVFQVLDYLLHDQSVEKTMVLLNQLPYTLIRLAIERFIRQNDAVVLAHLNDALPKFLYGTIRKIVRRYDLKVNYKHG